MPTSDLLSNGVELMFLGMGIVFVFLVILVFAMRLMSSISAHFDTIEEPQHAITQPTLKKPENTALIAVITAAVARYRSANTQH